MTSIDDTGTQFFENNREELMDALLHGDETLRALVIATMLEEGSEADIAEIKRELEMYQKVDKEMREHLRDK